MFKKIKPISIIGFGKLGSAMGVSFAEKGFNVKVYDQNESIINQFKQKKAPYKEKHLSELLIKNFNKLFFAKDIETAINDTETTFIIVPTPVEKNGS